MSLAHELRDVIVTVTEWRHAFEPRSVGITEIWEAWPDPAWKWRVVHFVPGPAGPVPPIAAHRDLPEEHYCWVVSFQGGDPGRWHGAEQWRVGGICFSATEALETCERVGPRIYELWASAQPRKN